MFTKRRTFIFSNVCLTQCGPCESYSSNWLQHFCVLPRNRCRILRVSVLGYSTVVHFSQKQLHFCHHPFFGFLFGCSSTFQCGNEHSAPNTYIPIQFKSIDIREDANTHKAIWGKYLSRSIDTAVD